MLSSVALRAANKVVGIIAAAVVLAVPPDRAYSVFWRISELVFPVFARPYRLFRPQSRKDMWRVHVMQRALSVMTRYAPAFDLKIKVYGRECIEQTLRAHEPLVICTAHFGLTLAAGRVLADLGYEAAWVTDWSASSDGWHWGLRHPLRILPRGPTVMVQMRRELENGTPVVCYVDYKPSDFCLYNRGFLLISPNAFHLASRLGSQILFMASRLEDDGAIGIEFESPSLCRPSTPREANLCASEFAAFVSSRVGWPCHVQRRGRDLASESVRSLSF